MFGIGMPEMLLILAIALIVIGPQKLPDLAKSLGRAISEFRRATAEIKESMEIDKELKGVKKTFEDFEGRVNKGVYPADEHHDREEAGPEPPDKVEASPEPAKEDPKDS